jgi:EF hand
MKKAHLVITVLALGASLITASAQSRPNRGLRPPPLNSGSNTNGSQGHMPGPPPPPIIAVLDADHNGIISAKEVLNAPAALLILDKNGDGQLTEDELRPPMPPPNVQQNNHPQGQPPQNGGGQGMRPPGPYVMTVLDTNHDGVLSAEEIANAPAALAELDTNGDGQLTHDEFCPPPPSAPQQ